MLEQKEKKSEKSLDDFFEKQEPVKPRIHRSPDDNVCTSCEG